MTCDIFEERIFVTHTLMYANKKGILINIIFMVFQGFFYWFTTIAIELGWFRRLFSKSAKRTKKPSNNLAQDNWVCTFFEIEDELLEGFRGK